MTWLFCMAYQQARTSHHQFEPGGVCMLRQPDILPELSAQRKRYTGRLETQVHGSFVWFGALTEGLLACVEDKVRLGLHWFALAFYAPHACNNVLQCVVELPCMWTTLLSRGGIPAGRRLMCVPLRCTLQASGKHLMPKDCSEQQKGGEQLCYEGRIYLGLSEKTASLQSLTLKPVLEFGVVRCEGTKRSDSY